MAISAPLQSGSVVRALCESVKNVSVTHAYIFEGAKGLGKRDGAYYFASALLCDDKNGIPCGKCESCIQAEAKTNPDIKSYSLKSLTDKKSIGVGEIREVISDAYIRPFRAKYKVYIIEDADALTTEAQNAMLKILEEPPEYVVFIMCVTSAARMLPTVLSRSRVIRFFAASDAEVRQYIENKYPHMLDKAAFAANYSEGIFSKVDELFKDSTVLDLRKKVFDMLVRLLTSKDDCAYLDCATQFDEIRNNLSHSAKKASAEEFMPVLNILLSFAMDIVKLKSGVKDSLINADFYEQLFNVAKSITDAKAVNCGEKIIIAQDMLQRYVSFKSAMMCLCIGIWDFD